MSPAPRPPAWKWYVCGLLLLATTINYMDRQTLSTTQQRIKTEFQLSEEKYGDLELAFGWAFATGALVFGVVADRVSVRWLYPAVLALWSLMGYLTGHARDYYELLICRTLLGIFEAGHWPCALKTTQRLLSRQQRTMGNSILQSGSSVGAIATPILMSFMLTPETGSWRFAFQAVGAVGFVWVFVWLGSIGKDDLSAPPPEDVLAAGSSPEDSSRPANTDESSYWSMVFSRRFLVLLIIVFAINTCWHLFRVWLPAFLQRGRGYSEEQMLNLVMWFYIATDVGCIAAGTATLWLRRRGLSVFGARSAVYLLCALLTTASLVMASLPQGWALVAALMTVGVGALGLFPCYYSFSQELSVRHQGKVSGTLGTFAWLTTSPLHKLFGRWIDSPKTEISELTSSYDIGIALAGCIPLVAYLALLLLWNRGPETESQEAGSP
jgi:ACS family hexuronate transporter-like MFS transporter